LVRVAHDSSWTRPLWVLIDVLTLLVALVLAAPDRKKRS
jgi:hypothetical protein